MVSDSAASKKPVEMGSDLPVAAVQLVAPLPGPAMDLFKGDGDDWRLTFFPAVRLVRIEDKSQAKTYEGQVWLVPAERIVWLRLK
jgi:hypothetical protein